MQFEIAGAKHVAKWEYIEMLYNLDSKGSINLCHKLTYVHAHLNLGMKMRVRLAAQVFSKSVAASIRTMVFLGLMPEESLQTATFCDVINDLFDVLNSVSHQGGLKAVVKQMFLEDRLVFLRQQMLFIESWIFCSRKQGRFKSLLFKQAWQISVSGIYNLLEQLMQHRGLKYVATRRFSQDPIENLFSVIRERNGHNAHPSFEEFHSALRSIACCRDLKEGLSHHTNCEKDGDEHALGFANLCVKSGTSDASPTENVPPYSSFSESTASLWDSSFAVWSNLFETSEQILETDLLTDSVTMESHTTTLDVSRDFLPLSTTEHECASYLAGYLGRKVFVPLHCDQCLSAAISATPIGIFIKEKQFEFAKKGLCYPTEQFVRVVGMMESVFKTVIQNVAHCEGVMQKVKEALRHSSVKLFDVLSDHNLNHQLLLMDQLETLFVRVRLHHYAKVNNNIFRQDCTRKATNKWMKLGVKHLRHEP